MKNSSQYKRFGNIIFTHYQKFKRGPNVRSPFISISLGELNAGRCLYRATVPQSLNMNLIGFCRNKSVFGGPVQKKAP